MANSPSLALCALCALLVCTIASATPAIPSTARNNAECSLQAIFESKCTANICFAIDGSGSINATEFKNATVFTQAVTNTLAFFPETEYGAVQFGFSSYLISFLSKASPFNLAMQRVKQIEPALRTFTSVGAGIVTCDTLLSTRPGEPNKMVVMTDGRNNFGGDPVKNADIFRARGPNNRVSTIGIGRQTAQGQATLAAIAGSTGTVLTVEDYVELFNVVNDLICDVCEIF